MPTLKTRSKVVTDSKEIKVDACKVELQAKLLMEKYNKACFGADDLKIILGVGETNIYKLLKDGRLTTLKIGRRKVVSLLALAEFLIYGDKR